MGKSSHTVAQQKSKLLDALRASLGVVETACKRASVPRRNHYDWLKKDKKYAAEVADIEDIALDFGESQLHKLMNGYTVPDSKVFLDRDTKEPIVVPITKHFGPDAGAVIFFLKTKGKRRGYIERTQVEHSGSIGGVKVTIHKGKERNRG
ncbi:hypothetical protein GCM10023185_29850 [Hymenobacter saemangeumensis]|uniref:Terminase n=1 Tax=Hymenobacter saemangeumensis TaxID=1084522 RepID=A0ABP8ILA4_9BACT